MRRLAPKAQTPVGPLQSGTRVHEALEAYYTPDSEADPRAVLEDTLQAAHTGYLERCVEADTEPDMFVLERFRKDAELERAMVEGYFQWLADTGADSDLYITDAEQKIRVTDEQLGAELIKPFEVVAKLDARAIEESTGKRLFIDHKTVQSLTQATAGLRADPQMLHYHLLEFLTHTGEVCDGALYNMLRKVKRTKKANPPFYGREHVPHNEDEIESYRLRMLGLIANVFELEQRLKDMPDMGPKMFAQPNPTRDCAWDCEFVQICTMFDDGSRVEDAVQDLFTERDPLARYAERTL